MDLSSVIREALFSFASENCGDAGYARERELVSRFVFAHLLCHVQANGPIASPAQIGVEVAVLEWKSLNLKDSPASVRRKLREEYPADCDWLRWFVSESPGSEGYAVLVDSRQTPRHVRVARFSNVDSDFALRLRFTELAQRLGFCTQHVS